MKAVLLMFHALNAFFSSCSGDTAAASTGYKKFSYDKKISLNVTMCIDIINDATAFFVPQGDPDHVFLMLNYTLYVVKRKGIKENVKWQYLCHVHMFRGVISRFFLGGVPCLY